MEILLFRGLGVCPTMWLYYRAIGAGVNTSCRVIVGFKGGFFANFFANRMPVNVLLRLSKN